MGAGGGGARAEAAPAAAAETIVFPNDASVADVTKPPYSAKGDGAADDTAAIRAALNTNPKIIYLPGGTYLISDTLKYAGTQKRVIFQGQSMEKTIVRLKDACPGYTDPGKPKSMIWTGQKPARRFRNGICNICFDTGRGNRRLPMFFNEDDYRAYLDLMAEGCAAWGVAVWAWCLMPNHVHVIVVPRTAEALARALGEAHRRYTRHVNFREGWRGFLWQGRFASFAIQGQHALAAVRYVERNPVRAALVKRAWQWPWSSAAGHVSGRGDARVQGNAPAREVLDWREFLAAEEDEETLELLRRHGRTGWPWCDPRLLARLEKRLGRRLRQQQPGPRHLRHGR
jgi:putative transposase